jgi:hypothetical protein
MTTTKLNATAPPFSSRPPPDLHEDETTIPASQEKNTRNDHDEAPDTVEPQDTLQPPASTAAVAMLISSTPTTTMNSTTKPRAQCDLS